MAIRKIIEIDREKCDACGVCIPSCAEHALFIEDNTLKIREDKLCDGLGACLNNCPKDALRIIEREADAFDHKAVEDFIACNSVKPTQASVHWPVKVALISPAENSLKHLPLTIVADCAALACVNLKSEYVKDSLALIACPKLENKEFLIDKFAEIIKKAQIKEMTIVRMEVPCCMLPELINKAIEKNNLVKVELDIKVIARDGNLQKPILSQL